MGQVYLGRASTGEPVAVKAVRAELAEDPVFRRRFQRELHALGEVRSPYTGPVADGDADAQRPWLATAYTPAVTLQDAVDAHGPLPPPVVCCLAAAIARALAAIHAADIVHRDLKPSNVLLTADGVQVIDFGIARAAEGTSLTASGAQVGSAAFMAPEQATGGPVGPAADVFALGCLLAYALTGVSPFGGGRTEAVLYRVVHQPPDLALVHALTSADKELDNLGQLISACLDKDPAHRPGAADIPGRYPSAARTPGPGWLPGPVAAMVSRRGAAAAAALRAAGSDNGEVARADDPCRCRHRRLRRLEPGRARRRPARTRPQPGARLPAAHPSRSSSARLRDAQGNRSRHESPAVGRGEPPAVASRRAVAGQWPGAQRGTAAQCRAGTGRRTGNA
jgi:hypothetical protein